VARSRRKSPATAPPGKLDFNFDKAKAAKAYETFKAAAATLAKREADRMGGFRGLAKEAHAFLVTLFPTDQLDPMRRRISEIDDGPAKLLMPDSVMDFLNGIDLPAPYWTARNPFLPIIQIVWQRAIQGLPQLAEENIETLARLPTLDGGKLPGFLLPEQVIDAAPSTDPTEQDKIIEPSNTKTANAGYVMISRWAMVVCAAIDREDPSLIDAIPVRTCREYLEWQQNHRTLVLPKVKKGGVKNGGGEVDNRTSEQKEQDKREHEERMAKLNEDGMAGVGGNGGTPPETPTVESDKSPVDEYGPERIPGTFGSEETTTAAEGTQGGESPEGATPPEGGESPPPEVADGPTEPPITTAEDKVPALLLSNIM
jgi:hypothetical protein